MLRMTGLCLLLLDIVQRCAGAAVAVEEEPATSTQPSAATTLGTLFRQARSEQHYYGASRYEDDAAVQTPGAAARADTLEHRDSDYFESRCITCDPNKAAVVPADRDYYYSPYQSRWRQRGKYDYYDDEYDDRRYRDRYDPYYDRARAPAYDYNDRYDPYGRNELFRPSMYDRYDPYERNRYYDRPADRPVERPLPLPLDRPLVERPIERPVERPVADRPYDRSYERGNGYDNLDTRYPYDERYDRYGPPTRPRPGPYEDYGAPRYDRYNNPNRQYGRYDPRYDRYDSYDRTGYRRPSAYDDRYERYGGGSGGRLPPPDSRGYYPSGGAGGGGAWPALGGADRPTYASAWNYAGGNRDSWREPNRERDRDRDRDRDGGYYRPRDYFYDSTAAPGGSRGTSYLYDRPESSTKPDADRDKSPTNSPQTQDPGKTYKD